VSLLVRNLPAAQDFYGRLFGWEFRPGPQNLGPYTRALLDGHQVAGLGALPEGRAIPVAWTTYFSTENADRTAEHIRESGGTVAVGPLDADAAGRMAVASDPSGAVFGVWEPHHHPGTDLTGDPGSLAWNELITRDPTWVDKFYAAVFGFTSVEVESPFESRVLLELEGRQVAGITGLGDELPRDRGPHWMTYFAVESTDASVARAGELGGTVVREPQDSAYGRQATVVDPEGAAFSVIEAPRTA
jgi:predicted enzyme related to lactoylglutathione lyase